MEMILIALVIGFAGGALGALVAVDTKTADITTTLKSLYKLQTDIETRIEKNEKRASLLNDAVRIIAQEQEANRAKFLEGFNNLWCKVDAIAPAKQETPKPEPEPKPTKAKAKKKPEGENHD